MATLINGTCIGCGACEPVCPGDGIRTKEQERAAEHAGGNEPAVVRPDDEAHHVRHVRRWKLVVR